MRAIIQSDSLLATFTSSTPASPDGSATGGGSIAGADFTGVADTAGFAATSGALIGAGLRSSVAGGSNSTVYSLINLPLGQLTSIRKFRNGS